MENHYEGRNRNQIEDDDQIQEKDNSLFFPSAVIPDAKPLYQFNLTPEQHAAYSKIVTQCQPPLSMAYYQYVWLDQDPFCSENKIYLKLFQDLGYKYELMPIKSIDELEEFLRNPHVSDNVFLISSGSMAGYALEVIQMHVLTGINKVQHMTIFCRHVQSSMKLMEQFPEIILGVTKDFHKLTIMLNDAIKKNQKEVQRQINRFMHELRNSNRSYEPSEDDIKFSRLSEGKAASPPQSIKVNKDLTVMSLEEEEAKASPQSARDKEPTMWKAPANFKFYNKQYRHNVAARVILYDKNKPPHSSAWFDKMYRDFCNRYGVGKNHLISDGVNRFNGRGYSTLAYELKEQIVRGIEIEQERLLKELKEIHKEIQGGKTLKEVNMAGIHKASALFSYSQFLGADGRFQEKQCVSSVQTFSSHMLQFLELKFKKKQSENEAEVEGWRFLPQITSKIVTSNTSFYTRLQEFSQTMTLPITEADVHLLPFLFLLKAQLQFKIQTAVVEKKQPSMIQQVSFASIMPNDDINKLVERTGKFNPFVDRISFGCDQLSLLMGTSVNEGIALEFLRDTQIDQEFHQKVLFIIRLHHTAEVLPHSLLDYLSLKDQEQEVVFTTVSHEGQRYSSEFIVQKYQLMPNPAESYSDEHIHIFYLQQFVVAEEELLDESK